MEVQAKLYADLKSKGALSVVKISDTTYAFIIKQYDRFTGEAGPDLVEQVNLNELRSERDVITARLAGVSQMIVDMEAL